MDVGERMEETVTEEIGVACWKCPVYMTTKALPRSFAFSVERLWTFGWSGVGNFLLLSKIGVSSHSITLLKYKTT